MTGSHILSGALKGAAAGAAATTALNALTYADIVLRGRPPSSTPQQTVEQVEQRFPASIPGDDESRSNRIDALGSLSGIALGVGTGIALGVAHASGWRAPFPVAVATASVAAMVAGNGPMIALGITDPRRWSTTAWLSDVLPHIGYGIVAALVLSAED